MSDTPQFALNHLTDVEAEKSLLHALMVFDTDERDLALVKLKPEYLFIESHQDLLCAIQDLDAKEESIRPENVRAYLLMTDKVLVDLLTQVICADPAPSMSFSVEILHEWHRKRELYRGFMTGLQQLESGVGSLSCVNDMEHKLDGLLVTDDSDTPTFGQLRVKYENEPPIAKIPMGVPFLDVKSRGGTDLGLFIGLLGDEDAGKTVFGSQVLMNISKLGHKVLFFPMEFKSRKFVEQNLKKMERFNEDLFLIEDRYTELSDIAVTIKKNALKGVRVVLIDSQMVIDVKGTFANEALKETQKFKILQRLAIRLDIIIIFICQRNNSHSAANVIAPYGSTHAKHFLHEIWFIKKNNLAFNGDGDEEKKGMREFMRTKSKIGGYFSKPMWLNPRNWTFEGKQYDEDDDRSKKTVGSGRKKFEVKETEYVMEDADGTQTPMEVAHMQGSFDMPNVEG